MSVVAVKVYKDKIVFAADSIVVKGWSKTETLDHIKLCKINDMIIGSVGNCDESSLMQQYAKTHKPAAPDDKSVLEFVVEFYRWKKDLTGDWSIKNHYILGFEGHAFYLEGMFISEILDRHAIGAGEDFANAVLYLGHTPREAVKAACELSCFVSEPIIEETMLR